MIYVWKGGARKRDWYHLSELHPCAQNVPCLLLAQEVMMLSTGWWRTEIAAVTKVRGPVS